MGTIGEGPHAGGLAASPVSTWPFCPVKTVRGPLGHQPRAQAGGGTLSPGRVRRGQEAAARAHGSGRGDSPGVGCLNAGCLNANGLGLVGPESKRNARKAKKWGVQQIPSFVNVWSRH